MKDFFKVCLCAAFVCLLLAGICNAQNITARIIDLPGSFNRDLQQVSRDDEGFIWFSTNEGLWRFDGTDVKLFDYKKLKLPQNTAAGLLYCYDRFLLYYYNDVLRVYNKVTDECHVYYLHSWLTNINKAPGSGLLFFTRNGQAWHFTTEKLLERSFDITTYTGWDNGGMIDKSIIDANGDIYVFQHGRVGRIEKSTVKWGSLNHIESGKSSKSFALVSTVAISSGYIAAHYQNSNVVIYNKQTMTPVYEYDGGEIACCLTINDKIVLIEHTEIKKSDYPQAPFFKAYKGLLPELSGVSSVLPVNNENNFLICTSGGLVEITQQRSENKYNRQATLVAFFRNKSIRSIFRVKNDLYVGTYSGFYKCSYDSIRLISTQIVFTIKPEDEHTLLLAIEGGAGFLLYDVNTGRFIDIPNPKRNHNYYITALYYDERRDYWLGGDFKALHKLQYKSGKWSEEIILDDSLLGTIRQIKSIRGNLYVAAQNGLSRLGPKNALQKIYPKTDLLRVYCMQEVPDGIWLGTHGNGLIKIDDNGNILQQIGFNDGLAGSFVYSLTMMGNLMVAGTSNGVSVFNMSTGIQPLPIKGNDSLLGLSTAECNHSAIFYDSAFQQVILGGVKGLLFVDSKDYINYSGSNNKGLVLSYLKTGGHETISAEADLFAYAKDEIIIKPEDINVTLKFASPGSTGQPEGLFRIRGLSDKWQRIKTNQEINLYALPPGTYTLEARLPSAINNSEWFSKTMIVEPAFYQTFLFKVMIGLCVLAIIYLLWRSKVNKIEKELQLRTTIASDLHDDIGSTLNSISVYTEVAGQQLKTDTAKTAALLTNMGVASRGMIDKMNDIVWAINPKNDDFENVLERMQFFAAELLSGKNMLLKFEVDDKIKRSKFSMHQRKNIYLIYKEAVNNAYKYSGGTRCVAIPGKCCAGSARCGKRGVAAAANK